MLMFCLVFEILIFEMIFQLSALFDLPVVVGCGTMNWYFNGPQIYSIMLSLPDELAYSDEQVDVLLPCFCEIRNSECFTIKFGLCLRGASGLETTLCSHDFNWKVLCQIGDQK